ncbi:MAG: hypothetical protein U1E14_04770 [Geminicoccaceae bacterium]
MTAPADRRLLGFLARHAAMGVAVGWLILYGLIRMDVGRIGELLAGSEDALLWLVLAGAGFAVTFGSLAMATAIFLLPRE